MRPREMRPDELVEMALRRARLREVVENLQADWNPGADAVAAAPYLDRWETSRYPGTDRPCLKGTVYGHPVAGDAFLTTSVIRHQGNGFAITESSGRLYVLGRENRQHKRTRILSGRRGAFRPAQAAPPSPSEDTHDDLPELEGPPL
ncbi:hypothetical protein AFCDBAGC_3716 [Methylobacterium cerastii]|uniref:Uncharacterized protein n=1 Tax=Methylobacterium cerastii TaxID=932741 RepID=A0ABQ4QKV7_9HYPH|nr:hypothetical protein [Methylobacterium cerastii]GJD45839.1 hypothetical protein AFCDBAGC_3716 [Methylobacterium cerastii]